MRKLVVLAAMLAMMLVAAAPAFAQATVEGDDSSNSGTQFNNSFNTSGFDNNGFDNNGFSSSFLFGSSFPFGSSFDNDFSNGFDSGFDSGSQIQSGDANAVAVDNSVAIASIEQSFELSD